MPVNESQLVGRKQELAAMSRALERVGGGQAAILELAGEPGIGKTRLLGELAADTSPRLGVRANKSSGPAAAVRDQLHFTGPLEFAEPTAAARESRSLPGRPVG